jgi:hypothetical protein
MSSQILAHAEYALVDYLCSKTEQSQVWPYGIVSRPTPSMRTELYEARHNVLHFMLPFPSEAKVDQIKDSEASK